MEGQIETAGSEPKEPPKDNLAEIYSPGKFTPVDQVRLNDLEKGQTTGFVGKEKWGPKHFEALKSLREKKAKS